jgi:hypothetical protein
MPTKSVFIIIEAVWVLDLTCKNYFIFNFTVSPCISIHYVNVSQTVVRGPQVVLGFCPCGRLRLNISPKKTEKIKLTWIAYHTL